ncbi:hypothetical protein ACIHFE_01290 [Streptomyces sp. NPDC052396]|uniref:hypothetical protein n=1 Tax=Streptomyces sp. NPDC052396 TaxID=3365689 RepID=UPI0037D8D581
MNEGSGGRPRGAKAVQIVLGLAGSLVGAGLLWLVLRWGMGRQSPGFWWIAGKLSIKGGILVLVGLAGLMALVMALVARIVAWLRGRPR